MEEQLEELRQELLNWKSEHANEIQELEFKHRTEIGSYSQCISSMMSEIIKNSFPLRQLGDWTNGIENETKANVTQRTGKKLNNMLAPVNNIQLRELLQTLYHSLADCSVARNLEFSAD